MKRKLSQISQFQSGVYEKPAPNADVLYLQSVHFTRNGDFDPTVKPQIQLKGKLERHLLSEGDLLFTAKGINNFACIYHASIGKAVASSSFIVIKIRNEVKDKVLPEYLAWFITHTKQIKLMHEQQLGTTIPSISMKQLGELEIDIPTIERQQKIIALHKLREEERKLIQQLEEWKDKQIQYLLSKAAK